MLQSFLFLQNKNTILMQFANLYVKFPSLKEISLFRQKWLSLEALTLISQEPRFKIFKVVLLEEALFKEFYK